MTISPKRNPKSQKGWEAFFPYYAGFPEVFAEAVIRGAHLAPDAVILDPWNGSGTTTFVASKIGFQSIGFDINPAMIVIARARLLAATEADALVPIAKSIMQGIVRGLIPTANDPLRSWFDDTTVGAIRGIEESIRRQLVGELTLSPTGVDLNHLSSLAATFYVALFAVCRSLASQFKSSNPTWLRTPKANEPKVTASTDIICNMFLTRINAMTEGLSKQIEPAAERAHTELRLMDSTQFENEESADFVLTSPPYCTRIDYTTATKIEIAVLHGLISIDTVQLSRKMMGSTRVSNNMESENVALGTLCESLLQEIRRHESKASATYYYKTHLDYYVKLTKSLHCIRKNLKDTGQAVFVVQDSYYKDIHNDLPSILCQMAENQGFKLHSRQDFPVRRSFSGLNPRSKLYAERRDLTEAVIHLTCA